MKNNKKMELDIDRWFDDVDDFFDGFAKVQLNNKWNYINTDGKIISNQWFDEVGYFIDGLARVKLIDKWSFINKKGEIFKLNNKKNKN